MKRKSSPGLATERDSVMVKNTTLTGAINLAVHLGVAKIVLLGIDQKTTDGKHWHHASHPWNPTVQLLGAAADGHAEDCRGSEGAQYPMRQCLARQCAGALADRQP